MREEVGAERYGLLLAVIVVVLLAVPTLSEAGHGVLATAIGFPALILGASAAVGGRRGLSAGTLVLGVAALVCDLALHAVRPPGLVLAAQGLYLGFLVLVLAEILRRIMGARRVTSRAILAGICGYLLVGLLFHAAYALLESVRPESFLDPWEVASQAGQGRHPHLLYFSFVTLTTLGFGDVTPTHAFAGMLTALEALVGQLYLAVLIASLVGIHLAERSARGS